MTLKRKGDGYRETVFTVPIYHNVIHVVVAQDVDAYCRKHGEKREGDTPILAGVDILGEGHFRVVLSLYGTSAGVIVHECFHLTMRLAGFNGLVLSSTEHEHLAYLHSYVFEEITKYFQIMAKELDPEY